MRTKALTGLWMLGCGALLADEIPEPAAAKDDAWRSAFDRQRRELRISSPVDVCWFGDSLTEFWNAEGRQTWTAGFGDRKMVNCGIAADRLEHIRFRIRNTDFGEAPPKLVVLLGGTNNLAKSPPDSPKVVAKSIALAVQDLKKSAPGAQIIVLGIPPNGPPPNSALRLSIRETNANLQQLLKEERGVNFVGLYSQFVDDEDLWLDGLTIDGTHFTAAGYARLAKILSEEFQRRLF
ncbi:MAG: GDSL-type esterase/lipase family protein [Verrucomicrobiota bacterium]